MSLAIRVFLTSFLLALTACAANETAVRNAQLTEDQIVRTDPGEASDKVCRYARVTGSQIPRMQCFSRDEIVQMEADAKARLRKATRSGSPRGH